jgi:molecular chaperone GrpE
MTAADEKSNAQKLEEMKVDAKSAEALKEKAESAEKPKPEMKKEEAPEKEAKKPESEKHGKHEKEDVADLKNQIEDLKGQVSAAKNDYARAYADAENMKRRMRNDYEQQKKFALEDFAKQILPVVDNCERALAAESKDEAYRKGVEMIHSQLVAALASEGVTEMDLLGKPYDANNAQAVAKEKKEDAEPGTVIQVLQKGYTMKDRLLRAAMVKVSE